MFLGQCVSSRCIVDIAEDMLPDFISLALLGGVTVLLHAPVLKIA